MVKIWKLRAWLYYWFSKLIWLAIVAGLVFLAIYFAPKILRTMGFIEGEMGM
ncbi:MAG: hypothetical protein ACOC2L_05660 [Candidatus Sumerlaeota bacterium]